MLKESTQTLEFMVSDIHDPLNDLYGSLKAVIPCEKDFEYIRMICCSLDFCLQESFLLRQLKLYQKIDEQEQEITEKNKTIVELEKKSSIDKITNLLNKRAFDENLSQKIAQINRDNSKELCYVSLDIDFFKQINDTYGHDFGDFILKKTGEYLKQNVRKSDSAYRPGGEEFALLLNYDSSNSINIENYFNTRLKGISDYIVNEVYNERNKCLNIISDLKKNNNNLSKLNGEKLRLKIFNRYLIQNKIYNQKIKEGIYDRKIKEKNDPYITFSIGVSRYNPINSYCCSSEDELKNRADQALYIAKANGRNCICEK
jgi:diguanylate cyclase (GGDEF)-like protein